MAKNIDSNNFFNYFNIDVSKNTLTLINDLIIGNNLTWNNPINCDSLDKLNSTGLSNNNLIIDGNNKTITINGIKDLFQEKNSPLANSILKFVNRDLINNKETTNICNSILNYDCQFQ